MKKLVIPVVLAFVMFVALVTTAMATPRTAGTMNSRHQATITVIASTTTTANPAIPAGTAARTDSALWTPTASASTTSTDRDVGIHAAFAITNLDLSQISPPVDQAAELTADNTIDNGFVRFVRTDGVKEGQDRVPACTNDAFGITSATPSRRELEAKLEEGTVAHKMLLAG
jgi:hypothetical protein